MKKTNILVVDSNKVVAKMVSKALLDQMDDANVDVAVNVWELKRRLKGKKYDLVIADLSIGMDGEEMADELKKVSASTVFWSDQKSKTLAKLASVRKIMDKPTSKAGFMAILPQLLPLKG